MRRFISRSTYDELHGNVHIAVFDIVHTEAGRKARGGELRAMYVEGEEEVTCPKNKQKVMKRKVVRGGAIRTAAAERGREINKRREVDMKGEAAMADTARDGRATHTGRGSGSSEGGTDMGGVREGYKPVQKGQGGRLGPTRRVLAAHSDGRHPKRLLAPARRDCRDESVPTRMKQLDCDASDEAGGGPEGA